MYMSDAALVRYPTTDAEDLLELVADRRPLRATAGELLYPAGARADLLYVVRSGRVRLSRAAVEGRQVTLSLVDEGMAFGHEALCEDAVYGGSAEALEDCTVVALSRSDCARLAAAQPETAMLLLAALAERVSAAEEQLASLAFQGVGARLAGKLLELADRYGKVTTAGVRIDQRFTHQQLSELIGTSRETLTKSLNELRSAGVVDVLDRRLLLRDQAALERLRSAR
jgi:CRP/FNR family transcriptional regulator, cyclic AMP receptor protein